MDEEEKKNVCYTEINDEDFKGVTSMAYLASFPLAATGEELRTGKRDLTTSIQEVCERIEAAEPELEALLPEADRRGRLLREAEDLRRRFPDPAQRPALYGVLVGVKDLFAVEQFATHAGSRLPPDLFAGPEASCVRALRAAGALVLGLTVATEFAYFEPGPTRNPHNPAHTPGGSSSGSAAAVAAGYCQLALGTQTSGSVIRPAAYCGLVGFKPSYERIGTEGMIFCARSLDTIGYMTQDLTGAQVVAPLLCANWQPGLPERQKPALGIPDGPYLAQAAPEALQIFEENLRKLEQAGYTLRRVPALADIEAITHRHQRLVCAEMAQVHVDWFGQYEILYRPRTAAAIREGQTISYPEYDLYRASPQALRDELHALMNEHQIDLWLSPAATGTAPEGLASTGNPAMNLPWTHAGLPTLTLPAGRGASGLPLGLQCVGRFQRDEDLLTWASGIEQALADA
jgi:Asp-tRNA(Asn)/Glu-tRNA(Gln) amidotransferase A subunit family amidase